MKQAESTTDDNQIDVVFYNVDAIPTSDEFFDPTGYAGQPPGVMLHV